MNRVFSGTILALALLILLPFPARPGNPISPLDDEKNLIDRIGPAPQADGLIELGRLRLQRSAALYKTWLDNKEDEDFSKALIYARSASELLVDSDEAWLLLGMLRAELKTDPPALAAATDALVRAVEINPANGRAQLLLAQVLMRTGPGTGRPLSSSRCSLKVPVPCVQVPFSPSSPFVILPIKGFRWALTISIP